MGIAVVLKDKDTSGNISRVTRAPQYARNSICNPVAVLQTAALPVDTGTAAQGMRTLSPADTAMWLVCSFVFQFCGVHNHHGSAATLLW